MLVDFKFAIGQVVKLENGRTGTVDGAYKPRAGDHRYLVRYCDASETIIESWFDEPHLIAA